MHSATRNGRVSREVRGLVEGGEANGIRLIGGGVCNLDEPLEVEMVGPSESPFAGKKIRIKIKFPPK